MGKDIINCIIVGNNFNNRSNLEEYLTFVKQYKVTITFLSYSDMFNPEDKTRVNLSFFLIENENDVSQAKAFFKKFIIPKPAICILTNEDYKAAFELIKAGADDCLIESEVSQDTVIKILKIATISNSAEINPSMLQVLASFVNNVKLGFAIFNTDGVMIECNSSFQKAFGVERKKLLTRSLKKLCEPFTQEELCKFESLIKGEIQLFEHTKQLIGKEEESEWCKIAVSFVQGDSLIPSIYLMKVMNITDDVKTRKKLQEEKYLLQTLLDNIPDAIYFKDYAHRYIKISKHSGLIGINNPQDAVGKTDFDFSYNNHTKTAFNDEEFIIRTGYTIVNKVERDLKPGGNEIWISTTKAPLYDSRGNITGIVGISRDVTDLKQKEEALKTSEERYRNLIEYSPDIIAVIIDDKVVFTNHAGVQLIRAKSKEEIIDKSIYDFINPRLKKEINNLLEKAIQSKAPFKIPAARLFTLTGELLDVEITGIPTNYVNKPAIQLVLRDITESKKQEKLKLTSLKILQASNSTKTLYELFQYIHLIIGNWMPAENFYIALYDDTQNTVSFSYRNSEELLISRNFGKEITEYLIKTGKAYLLYEHDILELSKKRKIELIGEPSKVWLSVPLQIQDKTIGAIVVQDYSNPNTYTTKDKSILEFISFSVSRAIERKLAEEEKLRYIEQLKDSNLTKDRFFSFISHDLRGPFSSLLGFSELVLEDFPNLQTHELRKYLETINSSAKNVYNLLNSLLQFSRFQTGRYNFEPVKCNLYKLILHNIGLIKGTALQKEIEISNNTGDNIFILADEVMISSAIQNLLTNSIKFTPRGGKICITTLIRDEKEIDIIVEDTGIGMSKDVIDKLFRIDIIQTTAGTEKEHGTGLGLLILKECVEKNKGKVRVESTPGVGSKFTITLPVYNQ